MLVHVPLTTEKFALEVVKGLFIDVYTVPLSQNLILV